MIHHVAIWVSDLEKMKDFYAGYFRGLPNTLYRNPGNGFKSYFLSFGDGSRLELMEMPALGESRNRTDRQFLGFAHLAFSVGDKESVDHLTKRLVDDGYILASGPRMTGDGFYESCVFDPELNRVEITV